MLSLFSATSSLVVGGNYAASSVRAAQPMMGVESFAPPAANLKVSRTWGLFLLHQNILHAGARMTDCLAI